MRLLTAIRNKVKLGMSGNPYNGRLVTTGLSNIPTLHLDFTNTASLPNSLTFTRTGTATRVNSSGLIETVSANTPRFDYDPISLVNKGLLIEEARTNLLTYSEQFDNAAWSKSDITVTPNAITAPDGTLTATMLTTILANTVNTCFTDQVYICSVDTLSRTCSFFVKQSTAPVVTINLFYSGGTFIQVTGTLTWATGGYVVASTNGLGTGTATNVGNGWWRITATLSNNNTAGSTTCMSRIYIRDQGTSNALTDRVYLWGAQLEQGDFATSYIPTTAAAVARGADVCTMTNPNMGWYNPLEGSFKVSAFKNLQPSNFPTLFILDDGTSSNFMTAYFGNGAGATNINWKIVTGTVTQADIQASASWTTGQSHTLTATYKLNDFVASMDGLAVLTDAAGTIPTINRIKIGNSSWNGHITRLTYYPTRLSNALLQRMSA